MGHCDVSLRYILQQIKEVCMWRINQDGYHKGSSSSTSSSLPKKSTTVFLWYLKKSSLPKTMMVHFYTVIIEPKPSQHGQLIETLLSDRRPKPHAMRTFSSTLQLALSTRPKSPTEINLPHLHPLDVIVHRLLMSAVF